MKPIKTFKEYIQEGIVRKTRPDIERSKNLIIESERKLKSLNNNIEKVGLDKTNANDYVEYCYDTIMLLIRSKLYSEGYSSNGLGAHEAEVAFLRELHFTEKEVYFLNELRYIRNGLLYYGKTIDEEYATKTITFLKKIHPKLIKIIKKD